MGQVTGVGQITNVGQVTDVAENTGQVGQVTTVNHGCVLEW